MRLLCRENFRVDFSLQSLLSDLEAFMKVSAVRSRQIAIMRSWKTERCAMFLKWTATSEHVLSHNFCIHWSHPRCNALGWSPHDVMLLDSTTCYVMHMMAWLQTCMLLFRTHLSLTTFTVPSSLAITACLISMSNVLINTHSYAIIVACQVSRFLSLSKFTCPPGTLRKRRRILAGHTEVTTSSRCKTSPTIYHYRSLFDKNVYNKCSYVNQNLSSWWRAVNSIFPVLPLQIIL